MDKSCHSSGDNGGSSRDHYLKHLSKASRKISKPLRRGDLDHRISHPPPPQQTQPQPQSMEQQQQQQPPVYTINKSDFRDTVQKLTGSPAHDRFSMPPPIQPPKPPSSRLQRIRPPPLAHLSIRPPSPPLVNNAVPLQFPSSAVVNPGNPIHTCSAAGVASASASMTNSQRPVQPLSPLPPLPAVHAAAESPISAYMRFLQNSMSTVDSDSKRFSALSPYPLLSPNMLFSPTATGQLGFQQFPVSPKIPLPSPRWKDI